MTTSTADGRPTAEDSSAQGPRSLVVRLILVTLLMAELLIQVDQTIVNVALPFIQRDLDFTESGLPWVVNAYGLLYGGLLPLGGRIGDLFGRRRVLVTGVTIFTVASVVCGFSTDPTVMVIARAVQGLGGALTAPVVLSLIITSFAEGPERQRAFALWGSTQAAGALFGLLVGGLLTSGPGWEFSFFAAVPIGALVVVLAMTTLKESRAEQRPSLDVAGAVTITAALLMTVFVFLDTQRPWTSPLRGGLLVLAAVLLGVFLLVERRQAHPFLPLHVFRRRNTSGALGIMMIFGATQMSYFFFVTLYLQEILGFSALQTGLAYLPLIATLLVFAQICMKTVARVGLTRMLMTGLFCLGLGMGWLGLAASSTSFVATVLGPTIISGIGLGLTMMPAGTIATSGVDPADAGAVSGLFNTAILVGGSLGLAVLTTVTQAVGGLDGTHGYTVAFLCSAGLAAAAILIAALVVRVPAPAEADAA
ncbi:MULTISPECIES: MFS transporter [Streptomyces]|uniref:MFS transporter n=1 Tax=Streptomyces xanthii TaxID=2768069 RepID=A0A7H1BKL2_9ACTN|nr:MFS transporter [Streptomyces xanthii]QNS09267.1 MFS transporter [Streptomyces xanthii]